MGGGGDGDNRDGNNRDGSTGSVSLSEGVSAGIGRLPGGAAGGGCHLAGSGTDIQGGQGLMRHQPSGGGVEGGDGDSKFPLHHIHQLPQRPPWLSGELQHRYRLPRSQNDSSVNGNEGRGPVQYISGPEQGV